MLINLHELPHQGIRSLIPYKPGKSIEELKKEKGLKDIIKMASNENPLGCSPRALAAIHQIASATIATYPSPLNHPLMNNLAQKLHITPEQLFLSNGSDYICGLLIACFALHLGKHVLTHDHAFSTYAIQAQALQVPVRSVPVGPDFQVDIERIIAACTDQTGLIFIANPNNPTGLLIPQEQIYHLLKSIPSQTLLVLDEAYFEYNNQNTDINSIDWLAQHPNLVITRTFSKIYGMAGLRLGYAMANPDIISILQRVQLPFMVNQVALHAANAAIEDKEFIQKSLQVNQEGMHQLIEGFNKLGISIFPSAANFITFNCTTDGMPLYQFLLDRGIIIRPLHPYSMPNYLRVSIGTKEQNSRFLNALTEFLQA